MKTEFKKISETKVLATINLGKAELEDARAVALKKLAKKVKVDGFRKGKAPLEMVAKKANQNELLDEILNNALCQMRLWNLKQRRKFCQKLNWVIIRKLN